MKHPLLKTATVLAVATLSTQAFAEPKVSGRLYLATTYENLDTKTTTDGASTKSNSDRVNLNSTGSRIRFTGDEKLNDTFGLHYFLEYGVKIDDDQATADGNHNNFFARNAYIGLKHKDYGTVRLGRIYTPDDDIDYIDNGFNYASGSGTPYSYFGQRTNNTIQYIKPFNNDKTQIKLHYALDEDTKAFEKGINNHGGTATTLVNGKKVDTKRDIAVAHILHEGDKFDAGLAYTYAGDFNATRGMFNYKPTKDFSIGIMAQQVDYNSGDNELGALVSSYFKITDSLDMYAQAGYTENYEGWKDGEKTVASIGAVKWLQREGTRIRAYATTSYVDETSFSINDKDTLVKTQKDGFGIETGLRIDF